MALREYIMDDINFLQKSFEHFNEATRKLQQSYESLEKKFEGLNKELEIKNRALERAVADKEDIKNYLENILESLITGVVVADLEGKVTTVNRCAEDFFELPLAQLRNMHISMLFGEIAQDGGRIEDHSGYFGDRGRKIEYGVRVLEVFGSPVRSRDGHVTGTVFIVRDITRIEKLEEMAKRTDKLTAMGEMAANIAHEIRNPLGSIELFASLLHKGLKDEKMRGWASHIISSVKNMDNKISNLLMFTRNRSPLFKMVNIHDVIKEILAFSRQLIDHEGISLSVVYDDFEPVVMGDAEMMKQVFLNLILNALQSMKDGGSLELATRHVKPAKPGGFDSLIEIRISDTGIGISRENMERIFEPFFSTREKGAGLGLAIVHGILDMHRGVISVKNRSGGGASFIITLPLAQDKDMSKAKQKKPDERRQTQ